MAGWAKTRLSASWKHLNRILHWLVLRMGLAPFYHAVEGRIRHIRQRFKKGAVYANVFEAAKMFLDIFEEAIEHG